VISGAVSIVVCTWWNVEVKRPLGRFTFVEWAGAARAGGFVRIRITL